MRLFAKFFLCATLVISIALLLLGYLLITFSHESAINRETERALNQFQREKFTVQAAIISNADAIGTAVVPRMLVELGELPVFFDGSNVFIHSYTLPPAEFPPIYNISPTTRTMQFQTIGSETYIVVGGMFHHEHFAVYLLIATDIGDIIAQREQMTQNFVRIYLFTLLIGMVIILILSALLTTPINKMNKAAAKIARGRYDERLHISRDDEIGELSSSFNLMADAVEDKIDALVENARQKEDFVANFAHELKTPLTSVIGYADMIYQKTLPPEQVKEAAWYILNEGLRLEALSLKLMDLIVLNRQDFILEEMDATGLFDDISGSLKPMFEDKGISLQLNIQPTYIKVEYDLFKTMIFNLIDNAVKAGGKKIKISGIQNTCYYSIVVSDDGRGMPKGELSRITEAFYTVDKSRSRRQHGAGIGLALVARIAEIHGSTPTFNSAENVGTDVKIDLQCKEVTAGK